MSRTSLWKRLMRTRRLGQLARCRQSVIINLFLDAPGKIASRDRIEGQLQLEESVLQTHEPEPYWPPSAVRRLRRRRWVVINVNHPIQKWNCAPHGCRELVEIERT